MQAAETTKEIKYTMELASKYAYYLIPNCIAFYCFKTGGMQGSSRENNKDDSQDEKRTTAPCV